MRHIGFAIVLLMASFSTSAAQTSETPVPFDTAGRILSVSPPLANRLELAAPAWPVTGAFQEARLFKVGGGGYVLTATRLDGSTDRYQLTDEEAGSLRTAFAQAMDRAGRVVAEEAALTISEPPRGPFVRDQMLLASIMYGPALAALTNDPSLGTGAYLMTVGVTFFAVNDFARKRSISKAQNSMTTDGALRGWAALSLAADASGADLNDDGAALTALIGGIGGSMLGYHRGRTLTHSEAEAAMTVSTLAAATLAGATASLGAANDDSRVVSGALLAGGIIGYLAGPEYPRRASYTVTAGDIGLVKLGAILGAAAAITPFVDSDVPEEAAAAILTTGLVGGSLIGDRVAAKRFNYTTGDTRMVYLGALGGGLMGLAVPIMMQSDNATFVMAMTTAGAIFGTFATASMQRSRYDAPRSQGARSSAGQRKLEFNPGGLALAAAGQPGKHTFFSLRF